MLKHFFIPFFVLGLTAFAVSGCVNHSDDKTYPRYDAAASGADGSAGDDAEVGRSDDAPVTDSAASDGTAATDAGSDALGAGAVDGLD